MKSQITELAVQESRSRSLAKTLSWRFWAFLITAGIVLVSTGEATIALSIGLADAIVKLVAYYLHERGWGRSNFGRKVTERTEQTNRPV